MTTLRTTPGGPSERSAAVVGIRGRGGDGGFVTAEAAVVLPVLVLFAMGLLWGLLAAAAQIQCVDAARSGARAAARQDPHNLVVAAAERAAPGGARVTVRREGDLVRVRVEADTPGPRALAWHLSQEAVALAEDTVGSRGAAVRGDPLGRGMTVPRGGSASVPRGGSVSDGGDGPQGTVAPTAANSPTGSSAGATGAGEP